MTYAELTDWQGAMRTAGTAWGRIGERNLSAHSASKKYRCGAGGMPSLYLSHWAGGAFFRLSSVRRNYFT